MQDLVTVTDTTDAIMEEAATPATKVIKKRSKAKDPPNSGSCTNGDNPKGAECTKKRNAKDLPIELLLLDDKDQEKFDLALEVDDNPKSKNYSKEFLVAQFVRLQSTDEKYNGKFEINKLTIDQMRKLCRNLGITNCGSYNKFNCRKAIATYFRYQEVMAKNGLMPTTHHARLTSTICRAVNVVFSDEFIEDFKKVNDRKWILTPYVW
jgi:hypothetical protein